MSDSRFLYVIKPYSVFNPRLVNKPAISNSYISEENRLANFIEKISSDIFRTNTLSEGPNDGYMAICRPFGKGILLQVLEPRLYACAAACIIDASIPVMENADLIEEIRQTLLKSASDGVQYVITQESTSEGPHVGSSFVNMSYVDDDVELIRNVSFLGRAVDIVKLDPLNILNSIIPENVLDYSFDRQTAKLSSDGRYGIPPGTKLLPKPLLDIKINTAIFEENTSFSESFAASVSFSGVPPLLGAVGGAVPNYNDPIVLTSAGQKEILVVRMHLFPSYEPKLLDIIKKHKREAKILINKITFSNIWRSQAKSQILTEGKVRLDLQGFDHAKYNYQLQVGSHTISAVLINREIANIKSPSEQAYAVRKIKSGFQQSLDDCHIYSVEFKKGEELDLLAAPADTLPLVGNSGGNGNPDTDLAQAAAFSLSATFEFVNKTTRQAKNTVTCSTAMHSLYTLVADEWYSDQKLDTNFKFWVEKKLNIQDSSSFTSFIQQFGTHYLSSVTYGGIGFQVLKLSFEQVEELHEKKISLEAASEESLMKGSVSTQTESAYSSYDSQSSSYTVFLGGTVLPTIHDGQLDFTAWSESVHLDPVPVQVSVSPISALLTTEHFPEEDPDTLSKKKELLKQAVRVYLTDHKVHDKKERMIFTSGRHSITSQFTLEAAAVPLSVTNPYPGYWSTLPYLFPTLRDTGSTASLVFYFCIDNNDMIKQKILNNTYCFLGSVGIQNGAFGDAYMNFPFLSFYGNAREAYFEQGDYADRCGWIIEKLNTTGDQIIRDGDEIRLKHASSNKYMSTTPLRDNHHTLTRTTDMHDAVFIIRALAR